MLQRPRTWLILLAVWWVALFVLSHQSKLFPPGPDIENIDKLYHTAYFSAGAACFVIALRLRYPRLGFYASSRWAVLFCMIVGALDEYHQSFIPNRSGNDINDWLADTFGGLLGSLFGLLIFSWLQRRKAACASGEAS